MSAEIFPPTPSIEKAASLLDEFIRLIEKPNKIKDFGNHDSDRAASDLLKLLIRNVESILCLCRSDLLLLPAALVIARSILESAVNLLWILQPEDPFERDIRLLALIKEEVSGREKYRNNLKELNIEPSFLKEVENDIKCNQYHYELVNQKIPNFYKRNTIKNSRFEQLLKELGLDKWYPCYRILSKFVHGSHSATWIYKRIEPSERYFWELIYPQDWYTPLIICYFALNEAGLKFLHRFGEIPDNRVLVALKEQIKSVLNEIYQPITIHDMKTYSNYTLDEVKKQFNLHISLASLFTNVEEVIPSDLLSESLKKALSLSLISEKARSEFIVAPILLEVRDILAESISIYSGVKLDVSPEEGLQGICDFLITKSPPLPTIQTPIMIIVEAKKNDLVEGMGQCVAEMIASQKLNQQQESDRKTIYGCITTGELWQFMKLEGANLLIDRERLYIEKLSRILGIFKEIGEKD